MDLFVFVSVNENAFYTVHALVRRHARAAPRCGACTMQHARSEDAAGSLPFSEASLGALWITALLDMGKTIEC